jgi:hypothetical protein
LISTDKEAQNIIDRSFNDPIANIILKHSNLTSIQYESLIIDFLTINLSDKKLTFQNKAVLRSKKVSRGSYSRSLGQARGNVISSIYTVLLLTYVGIFDANPFDDYKDLAEKLSEYTSYMRDLEGNELTSYINLIEKELLEGLTRLSVNRSLRAV